jgi:hypothetical protein
LNPAKCKPELEEKKKVVLVGKGADEGDDSVTAGIAAPRRTALFSQVTAERAFPDTVTYAP